MSGKKAQRTKGNTQPSSSSRSAKFLQNEGQPTGFITFSALSSGTPSQDAGDGADGEMRVLLRKMAKKDTTTKLKAMQEFTLLCKEKDTEAVKNILNFWPRMYGKMAHDYDHRVREATQQAHYQLTTKAGRNLAPQLKQLIVNWLMSQFDNHAPAANNAKSSFDQVFNEKKRKEVLVFCKKEILSACEKNILHETADTLSDPKLVPLEEREAKYNRFVSSMLLVLKFVLENIDSDEIDEETKEKLSVVLSDKKFWKLSKHASPMVRTSFFILMPTLCKIITSTMEIFLQQLGPAVLTNLDEEDPVVTKALWDAVLVSLSVFKNLWENVNVRKAVWPKFWKLLTSGCHGNLTIVYPNLLPLLSHITPEVAGEGTGFYAEFFSHITEVLTTKKCESDTALIISTYMECLRFLLLKNIDNEDLCGFIVNDLLTGKLRQVFHSVDETGRWGELFLQELQLLLAHLQGEAKKDGNVRFGVLYSDTWKTLGQIVFLEENIAAFRLRETGNTEKSSEAEKLKTTFYSALINFISFCFDQLPMVEETAGALNDEHLKSFLQQVVKCFIQEIFEKEQFSDGVHLMKLISLVSSIDLIRFAYVEKMTRDNVDQSMNALSDLDVCTGFVTSILIPLLRADLTYKGEVVAVTVGLVSALHGTDRQKYLVFLFEQNQFSGRVLLLLFSQVFEHCENDSVRSWLKSDFVEREITNLCCRSENTDDVDVTLVWSILGRYINILENDQTKLSVYHNKLLALIKDSLLKSQRAAQSINDGIFSVFTQICKSSPVSSEFLETLFLVFQNNILLEETSISGDAMNKGFARLMQKENIDKLKTISHKIVQFVKDSCNDKSLCDKFSATIFSLILMAQYHSYVGDGNESYGKIMLQEILSGGESSIGDRNTVSFFSVFLNNLSSDGFSLLEKCSDVRLHSLILECFVASTKDSSSEEQNEITECIEKCKFVHFDLLDMAISRCLNDNMEAKPVRALLETFAKNNQLTEAIVDHVLMLSSPPKHNYTDVACQTYCLVVSIVDDISCVRALVEMYVDDMGCNTDVTNNVLVFSQFVKVLTSIVERWYDILKPKDHTRENEMEDYYDIVGGILTCLIKWKEEHSDHLLFASALGDVSQEAIALNVHLMQLLHLCSRTALAAFKSEQWDFLLCSMISWVQSCEESLDSFGGQEQLEFMHTAFLLFNTVATALSTNQELKNVCGIMPAVCLYEPSVVSVHSVSEDTVTEWKELFLPTAGTSLLRIYMQVLKTNCLSENYIKLEQALCRCIHHIPSLTIHEFATQGLENDKEKHKAIEEFCGVSYGVLANGSWWNKIGCYQLFCGMSELIEGNLCYMSQEEDEDHEGMRSFPPALIQTMENSRDETLKVLSAEGVSIKDPLNTLADERGKAGVFTYLLSWQLILQLFKMASPSNRALFANYFHNNSDVHDLVTCLFCMMSKTMNLEYKKSVSMARFTFPELCHVAFHLLTTSMECIPALIRNWFNNHVNRGDTGTVNKLVSTFISPVLLNNEFQNLNESSKEFNNMVVKTRPVAREIAAVYTVDEVSMELVVQLGANHPLSPVSVTCGKRIGVSNQLWRQWMLQLNTFLSFQNGSILDGLALWKRNVDKRFEGVEECMVCFSVLHGSNYSLPTIACKTCKKKFHPACLYKWFNTSGKCTCPLCRNIF